MEKILKKSQFVDDGNGNLIIRGHIEPKTQGGAASKVEKGIEEISSTNESVATAAVDETDANKLTITWVGAGRTQIQVSGDADLDEGETKSVSGVLDLKLEEDEADTLEVVLDEVV